MTEYLTIAEAREAPGLRLVSIRGVPSPWTEAARGIFHLKRLDCRYAAIGPDESPGALADWAGDSGVPVVAYRNEPLRTGWVEILLLAERLAPQPALLPADAGARADVFGLSHEICGEMGLGWCLRLLMLQRSLGHDDGPALPSRIAESLAAKYGFHPAAVQAARPRLLALLGLFDRRLAQTGHLAGEQLTAADIYWATFANLIAPLPEPDLPALPLLRELYTCADPEVQAAMTDRLRAHQRAIYQEHLQLPVPL